VGLLAVVIIGRTAKWASYVGKPPTKGFILRAIIKDGAVHAHPDIADADYYIACLGAMQVWECSHINQEYNKFWDDFSIACHKAGVGK
jgi:hypothetical protein